MIKTKVFFKWCWWYKEKAKRQMSKFYATIKLIFKLLTKPIGTTFEWEWKPVGRFEYTYRIVKCLNKIKW